MLLPKRRFVETRRKGAAFSYLLAMVGGGRVKDSRRREICNLPEARTMLDAAKMVLETSPERRCHIPAAAASLACWNCRPSGGAN
jgi:hypothetical protein